MKKLKKTSDEELLNLYQSNSEENLLNILLQRHMPQIRQNVRSLVCNKEDVEDLCQDIYSRILIKLRQGYYSNGHIQAWIYRIVQNYVYSFYRKKKHEFITHSPFYTISNKDGPVLPLLPYGKAKGGPVRMSFLSSYTL